MDTSTREKINVTLNNNIHFVAFPISLSLSLKSSVQESKIYVAFTLFDVGDRLVE